MGRFRGDDVILLRRAGNRLTLEGLQARQVAAAVAGEGAVESFDRRRVTVPGAAISDVVAYCEQAHLRLIIMGGRRS